MLTTQVKSIYKDKHSNTAHYLIHLSKSHLKSYEDASIYVSDISRTNNHCLYNNVTFCNKLKYKLKKINTNQGYIWSRVVSLDQIKGGMIAILANINVVFEEVNKGTVLLIDSTNRTVCDKKDTKYDPSGVVLLCMVTLNRTNNGMVEWNKCHYEMMKKYKSNIITGSNVHHGSSGYYYAYV